LAVLNGLVGPGRDHFRGRESDESFRRGPRHTEQLPSIFGSPL
jgi:hypothetical protein